MAFRSAVLGLLLPFAAACADDKPVRLDTNRIAPSDAPGSCGELIGSRVVNVSPCKPP